MGNLDADSGVESFALYAELTKSHKWLDKVWWPPSGQYGTQAVVCLRLLAIRL